MDGLECSEITYKELFIDNEKYRIDSEFFAKKYLKAYKKIKSISNDQILNLYETFTDFHANGSYETIARYFELLDEPDYAYMVRTTDLEKQNYTDSVKYVTKEAYDFLSKSKIFGGELLINKIGSPGRTYLMPTLNKPVSLGMNLFLLRFKDSDNICEELVYLFFNTNIGKRIIERKINGTVPLTIDKEAIKSLYVPLFSNNFILALKSLIKKKEELLEESKSLYCLAVDEFNELIGIKEWKNQPPIYSTKSFFDSYKISGRLDAEYYHPKYDGLFSTLSKHKTMPLGGSRGIVSIMKSIEPGSEAYLEQGVPFIRVSDVDKYEISTPPIMLSKDIVPNIKDLYPKKDTILLSKDGSIGIAYKLEKDMEAVTSGALLHLTVKDLNVVLPDYLTLVLNSPIVQLQAERDCNGAIIQHWKPSDIEKVLIPILDMSVQREIASKVQESFRLREESKRLLDLAVKTVEMAIESDEDTALKWLESKVGQ